MFTSAQLLEFVEEKLREHGVDLRLKDRRGRPRRAPVPRHVAAAAQAPRRREVRDPLRDPIFTSATGTPLDARNWRREVWRRAVERAGVTATPHTLRHSLASLLFERGHTAAQVAAWLGHQDPSFTLRTYIHARDVGDAAFLDQVLGDA